MNNLFQIAPWFILIYGSLVALGGIVGYVKAKSQVSLVMGLVSGIALIVAWFISGNTPVAGLGMATVISAVLFVVFVMRFVRTRAFMPSGLMMISSVAATTLFGLSLLASGGYLK